MKPVTPTPIEKENINKLPANKGRIKAKLVLLRTSKIINPIKNIAHFFNKCSLEERDHAHKFMEYQTKEAH